MEVLDGQIQVQSFLTVTLGILVLFLGKVLNGRFRLLQEYTIPEPVSGGLFVALVITLLHALFGLEISFGLRARDLLLVYFFTTVGMNASFADLRRGGRALLVLLTLTVVLMLAQNLLGVTLARWTGLPPATGLLVGTVALIGGHGTAIAWAPKFASEQGVANALEIGIAAATFGLIIASASGGPIARFLIRRHRLASPSAGQSAARSPGAPAADRAAAPSLAPSAAPASSPRGASPRGASPTGTGASPMGASPSGARPAAGRGSAPSSAADPAGGSGLTSSASAAPSVASAAAAEVASETLAADKVGAAGISASEFLAAVLAINICIILGSILQQVIRDLGLFLPLFVPCLIVGILLSNLLPRRAFGAPIRWPSRTPALELIAEISLGTFLAMSLMTIQFWTLVDLAGPILLILVAQFLLALLINLGLVFPLLGGSYDAAVIAAGFSGFTLGSTPTAMANMTAVTQRFGPSPRAFIVLPLVSAFFIDLLNAVLIPFFLHHL